jgi:hypothetical protein
MRRLPAPEELVAAYWHKLTRSIESGGVPQSKTDALNGHWRSRPPFGMRHRSAALRNRRHLPATQGAARGKVTTALKPRAQSNSNS